MQINLIRIRDLPDHRSVRDKEVLSLYEFILWGRDLVSVVRIKESPFYRGFFFLKKIYDNFFGTDWKLSVIEWCPYREFRLYSK